MNFPYNNTTPRRRFSSNHYKRVLPNGESVSRSWLVYSGESDQVFCFCCKLFGKTLSPFCSGINTWEGFSKKLKDHENGISHQKCCSQWMLLAEGIRNSSTIDKREMNIFFNERRFWRNVLERLIDIALFLSERNLAFRGSKEVLGSPHNGNFLGIFELLASAVEIAQELDIDPSFPPSRSGKKRRLFDYQGEEEQRATPELKFKSNFFYPLVDQAMMSIKERFNLLREVSSAFSFLYTRDKLFACATRKCSSYLL